jgi:hypothetical protein
VVSQYVLYPDWWRRLAAFPVLLAMGTGLAWNNTRAVLRALMGGASPFYRTPKFDHDWSGSDYALRRNGNICGEVMLALYALGGAVLAWRENPALVPFLAVYSFSFACVAVWTLHDTWLITHQPLWTHKSGPTAQPQTGEKPR